MGQQLGLVLLFCVSFAITYVLCWSEPDESYSENGANVYKGFGQQDYSPAQYTPVLYYKPSISVGAYGWNSGVEKYAHKHHYGEEKIVFYEGLYFQGISEPCSIDNPELKLGGRIGSFIVGGGPRSKWTIYSGQNFTGDSVCVLPPDVHPFKPALITDINEMELAIVDILSVRKGCIPVIESIDNPNFRLRRYS